MAGTPSRLAFNCYKQALVALNVMYLVSLQAKALPSLRVFLFPLINILIIHRSKIKGNDLQNQFFIAR